MCYIKNGVWLYRQTVFVNYVIWIKQFWNTGDILWLAIFFYDGSPLVCKANSMSNVSLTVYQSIFYDPPISSLNYTTLSITLIITVLVCGDLSTLVFCPLFSSPLFGNCTVSHVLFDYDWCCYCFVHYLYCWWFCMHMAVGLVVQVCGLEGLTWCVCIAGLRDSVLQILLLVVCCMWLFFLL